MALDKISETKPEMNSVNIVRVTLPIIFRAPVHHIGFDKTDTNVDDILRKSGEQNNHEHRVHHIMEFLEPKQ